MAGASDVSSLDQSDDYIKEDADVPDADEDDEVDQLIAVEHTKYQERREQWQEKIRAARPWSAPALGSPRPDAQRKRDAERRQAAEMDPEELSVSGRQEYVPPPRDYLPADDATFAYMHPARSQSAGSVRSANSFSRVGIMSTLGVKGNLQNILEDAPLESHAIGSTNGQLTPDKAHSETGDGVGDEAKDGEEGMPPALSNNNSATSTANGPAAASQQLDDDDDAGIIDDEEEEAKEVADDDDGNSSEAGSRANETSQAQQSLENSAVKGGDGEYSNEFEEAAALSASASQRSLPSRSDNAPRTSRDAGAAGSAGDADTASESASVAPSKLSDFFSLPHPHTFAVTLLEEDTNKESKDAAAAAAAAASRLPPQRPPSAKRSLPFYGYLGFMAPRDDLSPALGEPASAGGALPSGEKSRSRPTSAPQRSQSAPRVGFTGRSGQRPMSAAMNKGSDTGGKVDMTAAGGNALRGSHLLRKSSPMGFEDPQQNLRAWADDRRAAWSTSVRNSNQSRARPASARPAINRSGDSPPRSTHPRPASAHPLYPVNEMAWSSQPHRSVGIAWARPSSATPSYGASTYMTSTGDARPLAATAAVAVGGQTVSVYVADTMRRIVDANRCLATLGLSKRYRLKTLLSNMEVEMYDSLVGPAQDDYEADVPAAPAIKLLTLKQFLSSHWRLRQQTGQARRQPASVSANGGWLYQPGSGGGATATGGRPNFAAAGDGRPPSGAGAAALSRSIGSGAVPGHTSAAFMRQTSLQPQRSYEPLDTPTALPVSPAAADRLYDEAAAIAPSEAGDQVAAGAPAGDEDEDEYANDGFEDDVEGRKDEPAAASERSLARGSVTESGRSSKVHSQVSKATASRRSSSTSRQPAAASSQAGSIRQSHCSVASNSVSKMEGGGTAMSSSQVEDMSRQSSAKDEEASDLQDDSTRAGNDEENEDSASSRTDAESNSVGSESAELARQAALMQSGSEL